MVVQGAVNPDEFYVHKPTWRQAVSHRTPHHGVEKIRMVYAATRTQQASEVKKMCRRTARHFLAHQRRSAGNWRNKQLQIEQHYGRPMDIEWAKRRSYR